MSCERIAGINTDKLNETLLKVVDALKPLGVSIECEDYTNAELELTPQGSRIKSLDCKLCFSEE